MSDSTTYLHLVPADVWERQRASESYIPEAYEVDGFIHLTIGRENLIAVANNYYQGDGRDYLVLELDADQIQSPVRFDDDSGLFPHVYGPLNTGAVRSVLPVQRSANGAFVRIG